MTITAEAVRILMICMFSVAALGKIRNQAALRRFVGGIADLRLVPGGWTWPIGVAVPAVELAVVGLLVHPDTVRLGLVASAVLLVALGIVVAVAVRRGTRAACHCFGSAAGRLSTRHVVRNAVLAAVAGGAALIDRTPLDWRVASVVVLAGVFGALLVTGLDELMELFGGNNDGVRRRSRSAGSSGERGQPRPDVRRDPPTSRALRATRHDASLRATRHDAAARRPGTSTVHGNDRRW